VPRANSALSLLGLAIRIAAAAVWIGAGIAKIPEIEGFRDLVGRYGVLPPALAAPFAYVLPFFEIGLGLYLAAGLFVRGSALVGSLLLAIFLAAQAQAWARGITLDCGCFGTAVQSTVGPLTVLRDVGLGIPTFLMLAFPARRLSLDRQLFGAENRFGGDGKSASRGATAH
jgi:uncharacterized membrane protein YphA (DoxX/SURF4 family)